MAISHCASSRFTIAIKRTTTNRKTITPLLATNGGTSKDATCSDYSSFSSKLTGSNNNKPTTTAVITLARHLINLLPTFLSSFHYPRFIPLILLVPQPPHRIQQQRPLLFPVVFSELTYLFLGSQSAIWFTFPLSTESPLEIAHYYGCDSIFLLAYKTTGSDQSNNQFDCPGKQTINQKEESKCISFIGRQLER